MKTPQELRDDYAHEVKSAGDILKKAKAEDRAATTEEMVEWGEHTDKAKGLSTAIEALEATARLTEEQLESEKRLQEIGKTMEVKPRTTPAIPSRETRRIEGSDGTLDFENDPTFRRCGRTIAFSDDRRGQVAAFRSGMWIRAMFARDEKARRWCINNDVESRALSEGAGTAGGVLVPDELNQAIISLRESYGVFRQESEVIPMGRDVMEIPRDTGDLTATFSGENTALTESDPTFNNVTLTAKKLGILTRFSSELDEDAIIDIADYVARKMAWAFAYKEDLVGFMGEGTAGHGGISGIAKIFDDDNTLAGAMDATSATDTFGEVDAEDIAKLMGLIPAYAAQNAKFYCSRMAAEVIFGRIQTIGGGNTIETLSGQLRRVYLGHQIVESQVLASSTGTINNSHMCLFGDLRMSSTLGDRRGISVKTSEDRYFELDQIAIKATERFALVNHDYGDGTNAGPIVALIGNT